MRPDLRGLQQSGVTKRPAHFSIHVRDSCQDAGLSCVVAQGFSVMSLLLLAHAGPRRAAQSENSFYSPGKGGPASLKGGSGLRKPAYVRRGFGSPPGPAELASSHGFRKSFRPDPFLPLCPPPRLLSSEHAGFLLEVTMPWDQPQLVPLCYLHVTGTLSL